MEERETGTEKKMDFMTPTAASNNTSTAPYSSEGPTEGPTLPILGSAGEHGTRIATSTNAPRESSVEEKQASARPRKKRKRNNGTATPNPNPKIATQPPTPNPELEPLKTPWMLLPPEILATIHKRLGEEFWQENCAPVVMTKNQNIRSGINKLKAYLGVDTRSPDLIVEERVEKALQSENLVVAVSAMGEATTKMVGVQEVLRCVVGGVDGKMAETGDSQTETWYMYTSLGSRIVARKEKRKDGAVLEESVDNPHTDGKESAGEVEDGSFEPTTTAKAREREDGRRIDRSVPVLTVWMSRHSILELKKEFGEEHFHVARARDGE